LPGGIEYNGRNKENVRRQIKFRKRTPLVSCFFLFLYNSKTKIMRVKSILSVLSLCFFNIAFGQFPNAQNFYTAINSAQTGTLSVGSNDLHWKVSTSGINGTYVGAVSCGVPYHGWTATRPVNANWISYPHTCTPGDPAEHYCQSADLEIYYKTSFNLTAADLNNCLTLEMYADNCVHEVFVNGNSVYLSTETVPYYHMGYSSGAGVIVNNCNHWRTGSNEIIVHIKSGLGTNGPTWEALFLTAKNVPTGLTENTANSISIMPNPAMESIIVKGINTPATIEITDLSGQIVLRVENSILSVINVNQLSKGLYIVKISSDQHTRVSRLIRQ
jgi:hypothetical protein